jgi:4-amino-4-deoxy-L-arabinose transferase-like glycosyltransferase
MISHQQGIAPPTPQRLALLLLLLLAFALRLAALDAKGLAYDEAATALMARATPAAIVQFHWQAAFEHPPIWQLVMAGWSLWVGQSEFALRFLPALAGVVQIALVWVLASRLGGSNRRSNPPNQFSIPGFWSMPMISALLVTLAPVLILYSQEARMYTLVVALALASLYVTLQLAGQPKSRDFVGYVLINWAMLGLHYYSLLLVGAQALALIWSRVRGGKPSSLWPALAAVGVALLPLLAWLALAPGFAKTVAVVLATAQEGQPGPLAFLAGLWRDLLFGAIRWTPPQAWLAYLLLPLGLVGLGRLALHARRGWDERALAALLILVAVLGPILGSTLLFRTLATRYLLFVAPLICLLIASGLRWLWRLDWRLGGLWLAVALMVAGGGLLHYFGPYRKSDYREMARFLTPRLAPQDGILLEAPRQHLLAKYYLPAGLTFYTAPHVELPDYWPVNAPPVVPEEMDDRLQSYLRQHRVLWLVLTAEDEVDKGEFIAKYLTAVSFRAECQDWLDVRLCRFLSPHQIRPQQRRSQKARFAGDFVLQASHLAVTTERDGVRFLLVKLDWLAEAQPALDYRVTVRLLDGGGVVVRQQDELPIGPLLPPTTWQAGDAKSGYMSLPLAGVAAGFYKLVLGLYDPTTGQLIPYSQGQGSSSADWLALGSVVLGDTVRLD